MTVGTTVVDVDVEVMRLGVVVRCGFQYTLSEKCYVQLVSSIHGGYHEGECLEGGKDASNVFTGLMSGTYVVLVYGLGSQETRCLPSGHQDYITTININKPTLETSITYQKGMLSMYLHYICTLTVVVANITLFSSSFKFITKLISQTHFNYSLH